MAGEVPPSTFFVRTSIGRLGWQAFACHDCDGLGHRAVRIKPAGCAAGDANLFSSEARNFLADDGKIDRDQTFRCFYRVGRDEDIDPSFTTLISPVIHFEVAG